MTMLDTTQVFGANAQFVSGSISMLEVELKNKADGMKPTHEYWNVDITAAGTNTPDLIAGREYTIKTLVASTNNTTAAEWEAIGVRKYNDAGVAQLPVQGEKFTAAADGKDPGEKIPFGADYADGSAAVLVYEGGVQAGIDKIIHSVQARASITFIGKANGTSATDGAGPGKIRLMLENANSEPHYRGDEFYNAGTVIEGATGHKTELLRALNELEGLDEGDTTFWNVEQFVF